METEVEVHLPNPHEKQWAIINSPAKRKVVRAGRRSGKTVCVSILATLAFLSGKRVLYAAPTTDQLLRFWTTVTNALIVPLSLGKFKRNDTEHFIEIPRTENRIRAKTAWNHDTLRGDYADLLILDEYQQMNEDAWGLVGAPMLLDNNGDAVFIYTPPSLHSRSVSKADDPQHAAKMFKRAVADISGRWGAFHFTSKDNPYISAEALSEITQDMTSIAYRMEILAEDVDEVPGALWTRETIEKHRVISAPNQLEYIVVGVDPASTTEGDAAGIITAGRDEDNFYVLSDDTMNGSPLSWAKTAVMAYHKYKANLIVAEANNGGEMVSQTIHTVDPGVPVVLVHATRGKLVRAEPIAAIYEQGRGHHVGNFPSLEDEMCLWLPGDKSPNRMDALVWAITQLNVTGVTLGVI